jgi:hypothetical protein
LNTLLRLISRKPLGHAADLAAMRLRYEGLDARHFAVD